MRIDILTLFPGMFAGPFSASIVARAAQAGLVEILTHDIREYAEGRHRVCDDYPFGGGPGMVLKPEPVFAAAEAVTASDLRRGPIVLLTPQGRVLNQQLVNELSGEARLTLICGHYEGVDERVRQHLVTHEISVGDYVLSGGEPAAIVLVDAVVRRIPGVLGAADSLTEESHAAGLLEYPQFTRPASFRGWQVPATLLSGHHGEIARWRRQQSLLRTAGRRPDLLLQAALSPAERRWLADALAQTPAEAPAEYDEPSMTEHSAGSPPTRREREETNRDGPEQLS